MMKKIMLFPLISAFLCSSFAQDVQGHWYLGTEFGFTGFEEHQFDHDYRRNETGGVSFGLFGGYQINRFLAVQAGTTSVSTIDFRINQHGDDVWVSDEYTSDYRTLEFFTIGRIPMGRSLALFGLIGIQNFEFEHDYIRDFEFQYQKSNGSDVVLGFGLEWFYNKNLFSRITFKNADVATRYIDYRGTGHSDVEQWQVSLAFAYRFTR